MTSLRNILFAAPLLLALAACNSEETGDAALQGEVAAEVAPPAGSSWSATASRTEQGGWLVGNPDAPIKLIEYGSLTCPACVAFSVEASEKLHSEYIDSGRISFEFRSVPLHGWPDLLLTRMLECAPVSSAVPLADQVWANYETLMGGFQTNAAQAEAAQTLPENQRFVAMSQVSGITDFFAARGISADQAQVCMADFGAVTALAEKTSAQSTEDGVEGTPTFFVNGQMLPSPTPGNTSWSVVEAALQRAGAR